MEVNGKDGFFRICNRIEIIRFFHGEAETDSRGRCGHRPLPAIFARCVWRRMFAELSGFPAGELWF